MLGTLGPGRRFNTMILCGDGRSIGELAAEASVSPSYARVLKLSLLAPDGLRAILHHEHLPELTAKGVFPAGPARVA